MDVRTSLHAPERERAHKGLGPTPTLIYLLLNCGIYGSIYKRQALGIVFS
jgi:hypothetical protein